MWICPPWQYPNLLRSWRTVEQLSQSSWTAYCQWCPHPADVVQRFALFPRCKTTVLQPLLSERSTQPTALLELNFQRRMQKGRLGKC